ncbi:cell division protein [Candidatus Woesearchaeota archaeon]|mgnify:CR=1 FL=1|nr:MAG: cell division protein [Candidatus Woesearchaeota archaeon]
MCTEKDAEEKIKQAKAEKDPKKAKELFLKAGEIYISLSVSNNTRERELMDKAKQCYNKAKDISVDSKLNSKFLTDNKKENIRTQTRKTKLCFKDIGGLEQLKDEIRFKIIKPFLYPEIYEHYGKRIGGGILMYGPPGCGKSLIAEATAGEANATFFHVKASDIKSKYVGEAERNIAALFEEARKNQPAIIFFDEFETLGGDRSQTPVNERGAITQLLAEMDGFGTKDQKILLLAATNEPWNIDLALRREGRFGQTIFVPLPDNDARKEIFKIHLKGKPLDTNINGKKLLELTKNFSGADIKAVCEAATEIPLKEYFKTNVKRKIQEQDFVAAIEKHESIIKSWFAKAIEELKTKNRLNYFEELIPAAEKILGENIMIKSKVVG